MTHMYFSARTEGRISYGHLGRTSLFYLQRNIGTHTAYTFTAVQIRSSSFATLRQITSPILLVLESGYLTTLYSCDDCQRPLLHVLPLLL